MKPMRSEITSNLYGELTVFGGTANQPLTQSVCCELGLAPAQANIRQFPNSNTFIQLARSVRGKDVFLIQPTAAPTNDNLMELLIFIETLRRDSAGRITAVIPYYGYGRTDKKDVPRSPITARLVADLLVTAGVDRILAVDMHAGQTAGFFSIPVDEITAVGLIADHFRTLDLDRARTTVVSPDIGAVRRTRNLAENLDLPIAIIEKRRQEDGLHMWNIIGDVAHRDVIVIDDEIDTGGTITEAAHFLAERGGARHMYAAATHAVLSGPAVSQRLQDSPYREIVVTDTLVIPPAKMSSKFTVLKLGQTIAGVIARIHAGRSVGEFLNY